MNSFQRLGFELSHLWLAGRSPVAPGTCGSAVAAVAAPFLFMPLPYWARACVLALLLPLGAWAAGCGEKVLGKKDPGGVVVDELAGQWLTYAPFAALSWWGILAGFILFRVFDIAKPWPVKRAETWLPGGWGVMIDDYVAGVFGMICLWGLVLLFPEIFI